MKKTRSSTKIAIGFVLVAALLYFGYGFVTGWIVNRKVFPPVAPSNVNLVGVDTSAGYYIVVANQIAQLYRGEIGEFEAGASESGGAVESTKKRVPIREMLQSMQGDEEALGEFVMAMNDMSDADFPPYPKVWRAEEIVRAVESDTELRKRLEKDLNVELDGTPREEISLAALESGIVVDSPVEVEVQVGSEKKTLVGRVQEQFIPLFNDAVWRKLAEKPNLTPTVVAGYYREEARVLFEDPGKKQNVGEALLGRVSKARLDRLAEIPERILGSARVIVNDSFIEKATFEPYKTSDGKQMHNLVLHLTDEGRQRLWQYSKRNPNAQLLVTWEGIAIAAPKIQGELALSRVTVSQLADETLVRDAVEAINRSKQG
jgi:hypothetical protein